MYRKTYLPALPTSNYFKLSNAIFRHSLTPIQLAVYSYLVCCAGQDEKCWPSIKTIAPTLATVPKTRRALR